MFVKAAYTLQKKQEEELKIKCEFYINYMIEKKMKLLKVFNNKSG